MKLLGAGRGHRSCKGGHSAREGAYCDHVKSMGKLVVTEAMNVVMVPGEGVSCDHGKLMQQVVVREAMNVVMVPGEGEAVTT